MIWWMTTHTLMKKFTKRSDEEIRHTNFLILSSKVNCTDMFENVVNIYNAFLCVNTLKGVGLMDEPNSQEALEGFTKFLHNSPTVIQFLATVIQNDFTSGEDTVFVTTPEEMNMFGIYTFTDAIRNLFGYQINEYPERAEYSRTDVLQRLIYYLEESDNALLDKMPEEKKMEVLGSKTKKELKRMTKNDPRYIPGMTREDMIELICDRESRWGYEKPLGTRQIFDRKNSNIQ